MKWRIRFSRQAYEFAQEHGIYDRALESVRLFINAMITNTPPRVHVKKLKGQHSRHFSIKLGKKFRIIFKPDNKNLIIHVARIDFRNKVYRKK